MNWILPWGALFALAGTASCSGGSCSCADPGLTIFNNGIPVQSITVSGPACVDAQISSRVPSKDYRDSYRDAFVPDGLYYKILVTAAGDCWVHIVLESGEVIDHSTTFHWGGCCNGYYPEGPHSIWLTSDAGE